MKVFPRLAALSMLSFATVAPLAAAHAQARPAAADVIAKYVTAIGGKSELAKITSLKQVATIEIAAMGLSGSAEMYAAPNKSASKMSFPQVGDQQSGFDGTVAWELSSMQGARLLSGKELARKKEDADFYAALTYAADRYSSMETVGDTTINGEKAWRVKMIRKASGSETNVYFSAASGLMLAEVSTEESQMGQLTLSQTILEYKKFGAVMFPVKIDVQQGPVKMQLTMKDIVVNATPESAFAIPEQVKPLIKP
jgi:hypothetical protein